jgi:hypothetical protein
LMMAPTWCPTHVPPYKKETDQLLLGFGKKTKL